MKRFVLFLCAVCQFITYAVAEQYTVYVKVPSCEEATYEPAIVGQMTNNWSDNIPMTKQTSGEYSGYYMAQFEAEKNMEFKFREKNCLGYDWSNEIVSRSGSGSYYVDGWYALGNNRLPDIASTLIYDYSDPKEYAWLLCLPSINEEQPDDYQTQTDMPVMYIRTKGNVPVVSKEDYVKAYYYLDSRGVEGVKNIASKEVPDTMQIKGRGNWTWKDFEKKPYRLKLNNKKALLGLEKSKHFGLLAHSDDWSGWMKNTLGFTLSEQLHLAWTPQQQPVEVVLNGDYIGLYMLTELVRVDKKRVNIVEQPDLCTNVDSIRGGWLIEIDNYGDAEPYHVSVRTPDGQDEFFVSAKTPEVWSEQQTAYLQNQMDALTAAIYGADDDALEAILDVESAAAYYLVQELMMDGEAYTGSCYLYKDMNENRWHFGPVWDFGNAFNTPLFGGVVDAFQPNQAQFTQHLIVPLLQHPVMQKAVQKAWNHWRYYDSEAAVAAVEAMAERILPASKRDWQVPAVQHDAQSQSWTTHQNATDGKNKLLEYYRAHVAWLTDQWGKGMADVVTEVFGDEKNNCVQKVLRGGQIVIIRGEQEYNVLGF